MVTRILIVLADEDLSRMVRDRLEKSLGAKDKHLLIDLARSEEEAKKRLKGTAYNLVVTHLHIPADNMSPRGERNQRGLSLLRWLATLDNPFLPSILISVEIDSEVRSAARELYRCELVAEGFDMVDEIIDQAQKALAGPRGGTHKDKRLSVFISLDQKEKDWRYSLKGTGFPYQTSGLLQVDSDSISQLADLSDVPGLVAHPQWEMVLRDVGQRVMNNIFSSNLNFFGNFREALALAGGIEKSQICFTVEKTVHPVALEALVDRQPDRFWMLKAPIYRSLQVKTGQYPLFEDVETRQGPFNCLIIEADFDGVAPGVLDHDGKPTVLKELSYVRNECAWLRSYLRRNKQNFSVGDICHINRKQVSKAKSFKDHVKNVLQDNEWHLVHYGGHSYYDKENEKAYIFFPGDFAEHEDVGVFATWLRRSNTRFVYLSSCYSSGADFVFELARNLIPAVLGFRWEIDDNMAAEYAQVFYSRLFKHDNKSLEYAFLSARQHMNEKYATNRIWAAPMLILQMND